MKSINELNDKELKHIEKYGHLGIETHEISELQFFYNQINEERKRRNLKLKELQKILPIGKYFCVYSNDYTLFYKVDSCKDAPKDWHITHFCNVIGFMVHDYKMSMFNNKDDENWQINNEYEFGWNANNQEMIMWKKGSLAPYETYEITEEQYNERLDLLDNMGFLKY